MRARDRRAGARSTTVGQAALAAASSSALRELEVGAMRQELATLLSSMQLLKEDNPGRKIAEIQGKLATVLPTPSPGSPQQPLESGPG